MEGVGSRALCGCGGDFYLLCSCSKPIPPVGARVQPGTDTWQQQQQLFPYGAWVKLTLGKVL